MSRTLHDTAVPPLAPGRLPLLGHAWWLLRDPLGLFASLSATGDVVRVRIGPKPVYVICSPDLVAELLLEHGRSLHVGGRMWETLSFLLGHGVAISNGPEHRRLRRQIQPAFTRAAVDSYLPVMIDEARRLADSWEPGRLIDVKTEASGFAVRVLCRTFMETRVLRTRGEEFADILHPVLAGMFRQIIIPGGPLNLLPEHRRYRRAVAALHRIVDELIAERRAQPDPGEDLLGILLTTPGDDGRALTDREVRDNIIAMLTAGIETVGTATEWALWLLAHDSEQQDRVRAEVAALGRLPEPEDLPSLRHTGNVLTESLRVHSAVWMLNRIAVADIDLAGYRIPEGADILWCPYVLHRDRRQFDHPEIFDPDRWLPDRAATVPRHALMPFAVGSRKCPADDYSVSEITALIATIAARWRLVDTDHTDPTPHPRITAHPKRLLLQVRALTSPASG